MGLCAPACLRSRARPCSARSASDVSKESKRTTVTAQDVMTALRDLEFDDFLPHMDACLAAYREADKARSLEAQAKRVVREGAKAEGEAAAAAKDAAEDEAIEGADEG